MAHVSDLDFELYQNVMTSCYRYHDLMLGRLLELAGPETTVVLLSDHGFENGARRPAFGWDDGDPRRKVGPGLNPVAWHRSHGVFVAAGPGLKQDELIHGAKLLDIAPTILTMLGLPVGRDMDGTALTHIFQTPPEVAYVDSYEPPAPNDGVHRGAQAETDPYAAQAALQQLVDLGYIDAPDTDRQKAVQNVLRGRLSNLAQVYFSSNRLDTALDVIRRLRSEEDSAELQMREVLTLLRLKRFDEVGVLLKGSTKLNQDRPLATLARAEVFFYKGDYRQAHAQLESLEPTQIDTPEVLVLLGNIFIAQRRWQDAERTFLRAIELDEDNAEAYDGLGLALQALHRFEDAVQAHMRSAALIHDRPTTHLHLGNALAKLGHLDWAIRAFEIAAELAPQLAYPHKRLAVLHRRNKRDFHKALEHYRRASEIVARYPEVKGQPTQLDPGVITP